MRRAALFVSCLAACGRFEFGLLPQSDATIATPDVVSIDAAPVVCASEGTPCDDLNICTASSTCTSGVCVGPATGPCTVADFRAEYSEVQGDLGWFYGAWNLTQDTDGIYDPGVDFEMFALFSGIWRPANFEDPGPNFTWAYIQWWGGHPAQFPEQRYPTRRWVSDVVGYANLELYLAKSDATGGDGVGMLAYVDGVRVFEKAIAGDDAIGFTERVPIELAIGTRVDVMLTFLADEGVDTSDVQVRVLSR